MAHQDQHLKENSPVSDSVLHNVPFTKSAARENVSIASGSRLDTISEDILSEEDLFLMPLPKKSSASPTQIHLECSRKSSNEYSPPASSHSFSHKITQTPPAVLRKRLESAETSNFQLRKELKELSDYTTLELQILKAEKGLFEVTEENMDLKCELESLREAVKSKEDLISCLEQKLQTSKSSYDALFEENNKIKKQFSAAENKLLEEGIKWEIAETKWKNREEELKKSLEEAWTALKVKEDRLTVLNEKIKEINERDIDKKINSSFNKKNTRDNLEKLEIDELYADLSQKIDAYDCTQSSHVSFESKIIDSNITDSTESQHNFEDVLKKELEEYKFKLNEQQRNIEEATKDFSEKLEEKDKIIQELESMLMKHQFGVYHDLQDAAAQTEFSDISLLTDLRTEIHSLQSEIVIKKNLCEQQFEKIQDLKIKLKQNDLLIVENNEHKLWKDNLIECKNVIECTNEFLDTSVKAFNDKLSQKEIIISKLELFLKNIGYLISKHTVSSKQELNLSSQMHELNSGEKNLLLDLTECVTCNKLKQEISTLEKENFMLHQKYITKPCPVISVEEFNVNQSNSPDRTLYFNQDIKAVDMELTLLPTKFHGTTVNRTKESGALELENCNKVVENLSEVSTPNMEMTENRSGDNFVINTVNNSVNSNSEDFCESSSLPAMSICAVKSSNSNQTILQDDNVLKVEELNCKLQEQAMIIEKKENEITNLLTEIQNYKDQGCREFKEEIEHITSKLASFELDLGCILDKKEESLKKLEDNFHAVKQIITDNLLPVSDSHLLKNNSGSNENNSQFNYDDVISLKNKMEILNNNIIVLEEHLKNKINEEDQKLVKIENSVGILSMTIKENIPLTKSTNEEQDVIVAPNFSKSLNIIDEKIVEIMLNFDQKGQKVQDEIDNNIKRIHNLESKMSQLRQNFHRINDGKACICKQVRNASGDATALHTNEGTFYFNPDSPRLMEMDFTMIDESRSHLNYVEMVPTETHVTITEEEYKALEARNVNQKAELLWKQQELAFLNEISLLQTKLLDQEKLSLTKEKELRSAIQELERNKQKELGDILLKVEVILTEISKFENTLKANLECKEQSLEKLEKQVGLLTSQLKENYSKNKLMESMEPKFKPQASNMTPSKMHHSLHEYPSNNASVLCMSVYCESPEKNVDNIEFEQDLSTFISEDSQNEISVQQCLFEKSVFSADLLGKDLQVIMEDPLENSNVNAVLSDNEDSDNSQFGTPLASHSEIQEYGFAHKIDDKIKLKLEYHQLQLDNALLTKDISEFTNQNDKFKNDLLLLETKLSELRTENDEYKTYVEKYNSLLQSHTSLQSDYENLELEINSLRNKYQEQSNLLKEIPPCTNKILEMYQLFNSNTSITEDGSDLLTNLSVLHNMISDIISEKNILNERYSDLKKSHESQLESAERDAERCRNLMIESESLKEKYTQQSKSLDDLKNHFFKLNELFISQNADIGDNDFTQINNRCIIIYNSVTDLISSKDELNIKYDTLQKSFSDMILNYESLKNELSHLKEENSVLGYLQLHSNNLESELQKMQEKCIQQENSLHHVSDIRSCIVNICNTFNISCNEILEDENNLISYLNNINNYITDIVSQNTDLNNKYSSLEQNCSELTQSLEKLKEEYCEFKEKNNEVCKTLETEVQTLNDKCTDQSKILLNTLTTIKDLICETKHLFKIEFNASSEESLEKVVSYLKEFFKFASETVSAKGELSDKCNQYYELNTNLELNIDNLKQKYEKLQSEYEDIKSCNFDKDQKKLQLKEKIDEIIQLLNLEKNPSMSGKSHEMFSTNNSTSEVDSDLTSSLNVLDNKIRDIISEKKNLIEQYNELKQSHETLLKSDELNVERCRNLLLETERLQDKHTEQRKFLINLKNHICKLNELFNAQIEDIADNDWTELNNRCILLNDSVRDLISSKDELNVKYDILQKSFNDMALNVEILSNELAQLKEENAKFLDLQSHCKNLESELQMMQEKSIHQVSEIRSRIVNICNTFNISCNEVLEDENNLISYLNNINNYITHIVPQNTELNNKYNSLEQTYSELTQSLEKLKEEYNEFKEKNNEVCKTLETEVQTLNDKCTDQSKILLNTLTTIKDLICETKHLYKIEFNASSEESLEKVVSYLKEFFKFASETASTKGELSDKCNQYYELNTNLELNIDNLKQKYEKLQSEYEDIKSDNFDKDQKKLQLKGKIDEIIQLFNLHNCTNMLEITNDEMECLKQLNSYVCQLFQELSSLKRDSEINKTELDVLKEMLNCGECTSDIEMWSAIKNKIKLITESSNEKSHISDHTLQEKIEKLESDLLDADNVKRKLAVELHGMEPLKSVYDLMKMPSQELYETFMKTIMKQEKILIEDIQNDCEAKITSYKEKLNQLLEEEKRRQNWVQQLEKENEKLSEECENIKLESEESNSSNSFPNCKESSDVFEDVMFETKSRDCPKCKLLENSQIGEDSIPKEDLNLKILLEEKQQEIKNLEVIISEKAIIIQGLEATLSEKQKNYVDLLTTIDGKQDSINELQRKVNELMATIYSLETSLTEQRNLNDELKTDINEKLDLIKKLEKQAEVLEGQNSIITEYENEISELNQKLEIAGSKLQDQHSKFMDDLSSKLNIINNLQLELEICTNKYNKIEQEMNSLDTLKKDLEEKQMVVCELRDKVSALSQQNVALEEKLYNELLTNEHLKKERDEIKLKYEKNSKVHHDEICPHKSAKEEINREIVELNKKHKEQLDNFLLMKNNLEEDIEFKSAKIIELDAKLKTAHNIHKQAMIAKNELCEKLERNIQEYKEKDKRFDEKINIQRDMYMKEKKNLEIEINNKVQFINGLKENIKKLEIEIDSKNSQIKDIEEKLKSQFDSFSNEIRLKNELISDLKEKLHLIETHNKEKLLLKHEISNKESIISDLKIKLEQSRKEIEISYIELTTFKNKILDLCSDKPANIEDALIQIKKNLSEINYTKKQLEELKIKYAQLDEECDMLNSDIEISQKELGLAYKELEEVTTQLKEEQKKIEQIAAGKCQLEKELADAKNEISSNNSALQFMESKICDLQNDIGQWRSKYVSLEEKECNLTKLLEDLKREVVKLTDEISNKNWTIAKLENRLHEENKLVQQKTDLLADYKTKVSKMKDENIKLQEKLDKIESVRSKEALNEKDKNIQVSPNPKMLGDIRNAQIRQLEERIEKLEKERKIYKSLCQHRQKKVDELEKALNALSVDKLSPSTTSRLKSPLSNSK